jgi:hypothetical protein
VPSAPLSHDNQILYIFPGLDDINDVQTILQPVLEWNVAYENAWDIASFNCCTSGTVYVIQGPRVNVGDQIDGLMIQECSAGTQNCGSWAVETYDGTTGGVALLRTSSQGQTFNFVLGGALEAYNLSQCSDYPPNGSVEFRDIALLDYKFNVVPQNFGVVLPDQIPWCNYGVTVGNSGSSGINGWLTLHWSQAQGWPPY